MDIDVPSGRDRGGSGSRESSHGRLGRLRAGLGRRLGGWFSLRAFTVAVVAATAGLVAGNLFVPFGQVGGVLGLFAAAFLAGLVYRRAYAEWLLAGAIVGGASVLLSFAILSLATGTGIDFALIGGGAGAASGIVGHYLGRDLRKGLTKEVGG
jgi:hypothetical protein